jgi:hypothetical protein
MAKDLELAAGNRRPVQWKQGRRGSFNKQRRATFLNTLAATCNVVMSAAAAGVSGTTPYEARRRDPAFAALWQEALRIGYERLEAALMARALGTDGAVPAGFGIADLEAILPAAEIDTQLGMQLLNRHRAAAGKTQAARPGAHVATEEETTAALVRKLAVLRRQIEQAGAPALSEGEN